VTQIDPELAAIAEGVDPELAAIAHRKKLPLIAQRVAGTQMYQPSELPEAPPGGYYAGLPPAEGIDPELAAIAQKKPARGRIGAMSPQAASALAQAKEFEALPWLKRRVASPLAGYTRGALQALTAGQSMRSKYLRPLPQQQTSAALGRMAGVAAPMLAGGVGAGAALSGLEKLGLVGKILASTGKTATEMGIMEADLAAAQGLSRPEILQRGLYGTKLGAGMGVVSSAAGPVFHKIGGALAKARGVYPEVAAPAEKLTLLSKVHRSIEERLIQEKQQAFNAAEKFHGEFLDLEAAGAPPDRLAIARARFNAASNHYAEKSQALDVHLKAHPTVTVSPREQPFGKAEEDAQTRYRQQEEQATRREADTGLLAVLKRLVTGQGGHGYAQPISKSPRGWKRVGKQVPYYDLAQMEEEAGQAGLAGVEKLRERIAELLSKQTEAKATTYQLLGRGAGKAARKDWGELEMGLTTQEAKKALKQLLSEMGPAPRVVPVPKAPEAPEAVVPATTEVSPILAPQVPAEATTARPLTWLGGLVNRVKQALATPPEGIHELNRLIGRHQTVWDSASKQAGDEVYRAGRAEFQRLEIPEDRWGLVARAVQNPELRPELSGSELLGMGWLKDADAQMLQMMRAAKVPISEIENHFPRLWAGKAGAGPQRYGTKAGLMAPRHYATEEAAEAVGGLTALTEDPFIRLANRMKDVTRLIVNQTVVPELFKVRVNGVRVIIPWSAKRMGIPEDYVRAYLPGQRSFAYYPSGAKGGAGILMPREYYVHPELKRLLDAVQGPGTPSGFLNAILRGYGYVYQDYKALVMANPTIHGRNIVSEYMAVHGLSLGDAATALRQGMKDLEARSPLFREGIEAGTRLHLDYSWEKDLQRLTRAVEGLAETEYGRATHIPGLRWSTSLLFNKIIPAYQLATYDAAKQNIMKYWPKLTERGLQEMAAQVSNDAMGHLPQYFFSPVGLRNLRAILFSPQWTFSKLRIPAAALAPGKVLKGFTAAERAALGAEYQALMTRTMTGFFGYLEGLSHGITGTHFWQNEPGKRMRIPLGQKEVTGRELYAIPPAFPAGREAATYGAAIGQTALGEFGAIPKRIQEKGTWLLNALPEAISGKDYAGRPILPPGATMGEKMKAYRDWINRQMNPLAAVTGTGQYRDPALGIPGLLSGIRLSHGAYTGAAQGAEIGKQAKTIGNLTEVQRRLTYERQQAAFEASPMVQEAIAENRPELISQAAMRLVKGGYTPEAAIKAIQDLIVKWKGGGIASLAFQGRLLPLLRAQALAQAKAKGQTAGTP